MKNSTPSVGKESNRLQQFVPPFDRLHRRFRREPIYVLIALADGFKKVTQFFELAHGVLVARFSRTVRLTSADAQHRQGRIDLPALPFRRDYPEHLINVFHGLKMVPPITRKVNDPDDSPVLQFLEAIAHVGTGNAEQPADLLGIGWLLRNEEQGMYLSYCAVDAPPRP